MRKSRKSKDKETQSTVMAAAALQDHMMRNLNLKKPCFPQLLSSSQLQLSSKASLKKQKQLPTASSAVQDEYVLDKKPPPLTLAQRLGLIDAPQQLLTEDEWKVIKTKANDRHDFSSPCVICKEELGAQAHVLLSCTHVFHKNCLQSFERHARKKTCPMCRKEEYQTRIIRDGLGHYRQKCAIIIQATWRGYVVRCWYKKLRQTVPPRDPNLRKKFYQEKLRMITDRMVRSLENDVNGFLREIDISLEASRNIFRQFEQTAKPVPESSWQEIQQRALERDIIDCPICLTKMVIRSKQNDNSCKMQPNQDSSHAVPSSPCHVDGPLLPNKAATQNASSKKEVIRKKPPNSVQKHKATLGQPAKSKTSETPSSLLHPSEAASTCKDAAGDGADSSSKSSSSRSVVILSCSHLFHHTCLSALEEFSVGEGRFLCPVCRSYYQKKLLD